MLSKNVQAYFGPHSQIHTNETNFKETHIRLIKPIIYQQLEWDNWNVKGEPVKLQVHKEMEFYSMQKRALGELEIALKRSLHRFNNNPPKFQNKDGHKTIVHVRSFFDKAILNLHDHLSDYKRSPRVSHVVEGVPTKRATKLLTNLDSVEIDTPSIFNEILATSRKGNIGSSQTNTTFKEIEIGDTLEFPIMIEGDYDQDFQNGDIEFPIIVDSDDEIIKQDLRDLAFDKDEIIVIDDDDDDDDENHIEDRKRKASSNGCEGENKTICSNKKLKSVKVEDYDSLGDFIPVEPITLSDLDAPGEHVFVRNGHILNEIYEQGMTEKMRSNKLEKKISETLLCIDSDRQINTIMNMRTDLPPIPPINDPFFATMAVGYISHNYQWEQLEFLGDRVLTSCLIKFAKRRYGPRYCSKEIKRCVSVMATNKILAAYTVTLGLQELNGMKFPIIIKLHADAFEAYFGAYYLACGESATCTYLESLMTPLFDLIVDHVGVGSTKSPSSIASEYFSMPWICSGGRLPSHILG